MYLPSGWVKCDECVHRGCECENRYIECESEPPPVEELNKTWKWIEVDKIWRSLDKNGREYPCVEYHYDADGFDEGIYGADILNKMFSSSTESLDENR